MSSFRDSFSSRVGKRAVRVALLAGCILLGASCTMLSGPTGDEALRQEAQALQRELAEGTGGTDVRRDLGAVYVRLGEPDSARRHLERAHDQSTGDPKTLYFLGLAHERLGNTDRALDLYGQYEEVPSSSQYRQLLEGRHDRLRRTKQRQAIQARAQGEVDTSSVSPRTVAVFPLAYQGGNSTYAPLGRGLGELLLTDLSNVGRLRVVERIRLQALFNEMELAQSEYVDPSTAPRVGRLIGAGRLIGGTYDVDTGEQDEERITVDLSIVNLAGAVQAPGQDSTTGAVSELFDLQKDLVFDLIDRLGVELTAEERAAIEEVPTRNLEAFLAYSQGLEAEDRGRYDVAAQHYQRAAQLDPDFEAAVQGREKAQQLDETGESGSQALAGASGEQAPSSLDLQELRQNNLSGQAAPPRQPTGEQTTASEDLLKEAPPLPSDGGSQ